MSIIANVQYSIKEEVEKNDVDGSTVTRYVVLGPNNLQIGDDCNSPLEASALLFNELKKISEVEKKEAATVKASVSKKKNF